MYRSDTARADYRRIVKLLAVLFLVAEFAVPLFSMGFGVNAMRIRTGDPANGAYWRGWFYGVETGRELGTRLVRIPTTLAAPTEEVDALPNHTFRLVAGPTGLWLVSDVEVGCYTGTGQVQWQRALHGLPHEFGRPFMLHGRPAVIVVDNAHLIIRAWTGRDWQSAGHVNAPVGVDDITMLPSGIVYRYGGSLFASGHPVTLPDDVGDVWAVAQVHGRFTVLGLTEGHEVLGLQRRGKNWTSYGRVEVGDSVKAGLFVTENGFVLVTQGVGGSYRVVRSERNALTFEGHSGGGGASGLLTWVVEANVALLLCMLVLGRCVDETARRYRMPFYVTEDGHEVRLAPVWRRGLALAIDSLIVLGPGYYVQGRDMFRMMDGLQSLMVPQVFLWPLVAGIALSVFEGLAGITVGKALLHLRVVRTDLQRCGVWRALFRRFLLMFDCGCGGLLGFLSLGLSDATQRLGDRACDTIVIEV